MAIAPLDKPEPKLTDLMDINVLHEILSVFSTVTQMSVAVCAPDGEILSRLAGANAFCRLMGNSEQGKLACRRSLQDAVQLAIEEGSRVSIRCHAGIVQHAMPIIVGGKVLAVIAMGDLPTGPLEDDEIDELVDAYNVDRPGLVRALDSSRAWSQAQVEAAVEFLQLLANTLARLCHQEDQLRRRIDELVTMYDITRLLVGTEDLDDVLRNIAGTVVKVLHVKSCSIRLLDRDTGELKIAAGHNLSGQYLAKGPVKVGENPIDKAALDGETVTIVDVKSDPRIRYPAQAEKEGLVSGLVTGMVYHGKSVGVLRVYTGEKHTFSAFEASLLRTVAAVAAAAIENRRLTDEAIRSELVTRQIKVAGEVQRRMVPEAPPRHAHLEFGAVYEPSYDLGGDFYDYLELPDGLLGVAIADVVGKGVPASLVMASVRSALRVYADGLGPLDQILTRVNRQLCRDTLPHEFATLFYGVFSAEGRAMTYCNAGHDPPLLVRDGQITRLTTGGMLLGTKCDAVYQLATIDLQPGDVVLLYTDGAVDAMNFLSERFGRDRLAESLKRYAALSAHAIAPNILWDVRRFIGLADQTDDITMVSVKIVK